MTLGMVVRDDNGGLGNLTLEAWRHLRPDVTVVVQARPCRGEPHPGVFEEAWTETVTMPNPMTRRDWRKVAGMADVWWSAETWYCDEAEATIREAGGRSVLYVMPELFGGSDADALWNPTDYLHERLPERARVVDWPLSPPARWEPRTSVRRILHVSGGAAHDRNGTELLVEALRRVRTPCEVLLHQPDVLHRLPPRVLASLPSHVTVKQTTDYATSMGSLYRWADLLVLPRRYAGLCLPALEALGYGTLVMMPDVDPQVRWPIVTVEATQERPVRMKGGRVPMWSVGATTLARRIEDVLAWDEARVLEWSERGRVWTEARSWPVLLPVWRDELERAGCE